MDKEATSTTSIASLRARRGAIKRAIIRIDKDMKNIELKEIQHWQSAELSCHLEKLKEKAANYEIVQNEILDLIESDSHSGRQAEEEKDYDEQTQLHTQLRSVLQRCISLAQGYEQGNRIACQLHAVENTDSLKGLSHRSKLDGYEEKITDMISVSLSEASQADTSLQRLQYSLFKRVSKLRKRWEEENTSVVDKTPIPCCSKEQGPRTKLPEIKLPTFTGGMMEWPLFWESFTSILKKEPKLSNSDKLYYLRGAMQCEQGQDLVVSAMGSGDDFDAVALALDRCFNRKRLIFKELVSRVLKNRLPSHTHEELSKEGNFWRKSLMELRRAGFNGDTLLTAIAELHMNDKTFEEWSVFTNKSPRTPGIDEYVEFIDSRVDSLPQRTNTKTSAPLANKKKSSGAPVFHAREQPRCPQCQGDHQLYRCSAFQGMSVEVRGTTAQKLRVCLNCLSPDHCVKSCTSKRSCQYCGRRHHSMLHRRSTANSNASSASDSSHHTLLSAGNGETPLLMTCQVLAFANGLPRLARVLLDSGSTITLISSSFAKQLNAKQTPLRKDIAMLGNTTTKSTAAVDLVLRSRLDDHLEIECSAHVVPTIVEQMPSRRIAEVRGSNFLKGLKLADPAFDCPGRIDILLGIDHCQDVILGEVKKSQDNRLQLRDTLFGWAVSGRWETATPSVLAHSCMVTTSTDIETQDLIEKFWKIEESQSTVPALTVEDNAAIDHFHDTYQRDDTGRYMVRLPKRNEQLKLGDSRTNAVRRFRQNQKSLRKRDQWHTFDSVIQEYEDLGHAEPVPPADLAKVEADYCYLPMHGVIKESSTSTKLRVVFDASAKTSSGLALNDTLLRGPTMYPLLPSVLTQFRCHDIGMSADISKMFREVLLHPDDRDLHRFVRADPTSDSIQDWRMCRVTFGVICSPFLATQVLRQVASDYKEEFPIAAEIVNTTFYVDDCLTGASTVNEAIIIREQLNGLLSKACMVLRKWRSNSSSLLQSIPEDLKEKDEVHVISSPAQCQKALGVHWNTTIDTLHISTPELKRLERPTKRQVASGIAKVFDVLGWFAPAVVNVKLLMQKLWQLKVDWDSPLPEDLAQEWESWRKDSRLLTEWPIPRCLHQPNRSRLLVQLHGFADASQKAYAGVVYVRTVYTDTGISTSLVSAKTRIAPLHPQTIPRLELCAAQLLTHLLRTIMKDLDISVQNVFAWSDSMITLGWINRSPQQSKVFVANRVSDIIASIPPSHWRHVPTETNPADPASRGLSPVELLAHTFWWTGPPWLSLPPDQWPQHQVSKEKDLPEARARILHVSTPEDDFTSRFSSFSRMLRVTAWCRRFTSNTKEIKGNRNSSLTLSVTELELAEDCLTRTSQSQHFTQEISNLRVGKELPRHSTILQLRPLLDKKGLLRVGGRLQKSELNDDEKHPIILHRRARLTRLLLLHQHLRSQHAGPSTFLNLLAETHHVIGAKRLAKDLSKSCIICRRSYARTAKQLMGVLPTVRVTPAPPFSHVGADFAGPITLRRGHTRKPVYDKAYICLYVCLATKAVHIELVSDLSTEAFLASLRRFISRRGRPSYIMTDNGTNFVGARRELQDVYDWLEKESTQQGLNNYCTKEKIRWQHSPGRAPHFGGLWEAAVKSTKTLLHKTLHLQRLTYEDYSTVLTEVEAVLNSRPLVPVDSMADDGQWVLTPGHFLIGRPLLTLPQGSNNKKQISHNKRWNLCQTLINQFWEKWTKEYLHILNQRNKWKHPQRSITKGDVVLLKDQELFKRSWPLALVTDIHPGKDGHVRVATVKTQQGIYTRPIVRMVPLLPEGEQLPPPEDVQASKT